MNSNNTRSSRTKKPDQVKVIMYNVGFGDCFLLKFRYPNEERCILIDCGSTSKNKEYINKVVDKLVDDCNQKIHAIVATHRHKDHISAFGLKGIKDKLKALKPDIVIQPWTEHPKAEEDDLNAPSVFTKSAVNHISSLRSAQQFANHLVKNPERILSSAGPRIQSQIIRLANLSIPNKAAILTLNEMSKEHAYVYKGSKSGLEKILPGVKISVLGPPTLTQSENIRRQTSWDEDEFWKVYAHLAGKSVTNLNSRRGHSALFPKAKTQTIAKAPSYVKWAIKQLDDVQLHLVRQIVRALDRALNNTSIILLFEIGEKMLLFPGDAQLESWENVLSDQNLVQKLQKVTFYKVGHHGSTNATPKSLWEYFTDKRTSDKELITLLSTQKGHHHDVPRKSLVDALKSNSKLHSTEGWSTTLKREYII